MSELYYNPITGSTYGEPTRDELQENAFLLDAEYRGNGINIDSPNLDSKIRNYLSRDRLKTYAMFINLVEHITDVENPHYIRKPVRYWRTASGKPVSKVLQERLEDIYAQMDFDRTLLEYSRQAAYEGTLMVRPVRDQFNKSMALHKLTPSLEDFDIEQDDLRASKAKKVKYLGIYENKPAKYEWDYRYLRILDGDKETDVWLEEEHGFTEHAGALGGMPFATLRYKTDSNRFWGPYDGSLAALCKTRSLLISDAIHRTQTSLFEMLIFAGFAPEEAIAAARTRSSSGIISFEFDKKDDETSDSDSKDIKYVSPEGMAPEKVFDLWLSLYRFTLTSRGHSGKNFDSSKLVNTAEAQRLANIALKDKQESRKVSLAQFEKDIFKRITWENNRHPAGFEIPEGTIVEIDWQPDKEFFDSATDKARYYEMGLDRNILTAPEVIRMENPELSREAAEEKFLENKKFNAEQAGEPANNQPQIQEGE